MPVKKKKPQLTVILGSIREQRFCDTVAKWVYTQLQQHALFEYDVLDIRDLAPSYNANETSMQRLSTADAYLVITPEYNHGYPGLLKTLLDTAGQPWQAKVVAFVAYGGISGGLRAVEQLRQVFAELHVCTMRECISFINAWQQFDANGNLHTPDNANNAMAVLIKRLDWWATALANARADAPYASVQ